jgi:hypothetical protein
LYAFMFFHQQLYLTHFNPIPFMYPFFSTYNNASPTVTPPTSTTHTAAPKAPYSTGDNLPAALFPLALALGVVLVVLIDMVLSAVAVAGREERAEAWVYVAVRPVALVQDEGIEDAEPETKFTAAHFWLSVPFHLSWTKQRKERDSGEKGKRKG